MHTEPKLPTPAEIDEAAKEYCKLDQEIANLRAETSTKIAPLMERQKPLEEKLKAWADQFGGAHATKSKLLTGLAYEVMTTVSSSTSLDQAAAGVFLDACKKAGVSRIFSRLFETLTMYRSRPEADQVARKELPTRLAVAFMRCFITKTNAPRMEVRLRKAAAGVSA